MKSQRNLRRQTTLPPVSTGLGCMCLVFMCIFLPSMGTQCNMSRVLGLFLNLQLTSNSQATHKQLTSNSLVKHLRTHFNPSQIPQNPPQIPSTYVKNLLPFTGGRFIQKKDKEVSTCDIDVILSCFLPT